MKNLLSIDDLSAEDIKNIMEISSSMLEVLSRDIKKVPTLRGRTVTLMFFEPSTRTRVSFELASKALSADTVNFSISESSIKKGETFLDTIKTITALGSDFLIIRHSGEGFPHLVSKHTEIPVVNAGDGKNEHPTQALLDLFTMMQKKKVKDPFELKGARISIVGDILHSRVARSGIKLFSKIGMDITVVSPSTTLPPKLEEIWGVRHKSFFDDEFFSSDFIMLLRVQKERHGKSYYPSDREYNEFWGIDEKVFSELKKKGSVIMHPGPMNLGIEIIPDVAYSPSSAVLEQVKNGVAVRMAVLYYLSQKK